MTSKKTNKLIFAFVVLLSVFSFVYTNLEACNTVNNAEYSYDVESEDMENHINLLPDIYFVKELLSRGLDILGSNF